MAKPTNHYLRACFDADFAAMAKTIGRCLGVAVVIACVVPMQSMAEDQTHLIEPIPAIDLMKLDGDSQAVYVAGIMEGMAYVQYNYSMPEYAIWAACVRQKTLGDTTTEVVAFLKDHPKEEAVSFALTQTLGARCKH